MSEPDDATDQSADDSTDDPSDDGQSGDGQSDDGGTILDDGGVDTDERAGRSLGIDPQSEPDEDTKNEMEEERERRLDPDNRPDGAEIDNTDRDFDVDRGMFTDNDEYDGSDPAPFSDPEDPNNSDNSDADNSDSEDSDSEDSDSEHSESDEEAPS